MIEKVFKVKYSTREKHSKRFRDLQAVHVLSQPWCAAVPVQRWSRAELGSVPSRPGQDVPAALGAQPGPAGKSRGGSCWTPASHEGRLGQRNTRCQVSSTCPLQRVWLFHFYPFKQYLYNKQPGCGRISLGKN